MNHSEIKNVARIGLALQQQAMEKLEEQLNDDFVAASNLLAHAPKVVTTGIGKSGFIARKMAATLTSVYIPSVYLHPVDALHGDLGILNPSDVLVAFSKSGETPEVIALVALAKDIGMSIVTITSRPNSTLASKSTVALLAPIVRELDPHDLLPTASTTQALVLADLLCVAAAQQNGDMITRLSKSHPRGSIGAVLTGCVSDVMHTGSDLPRVELSATLADAIGVLTKTALGIVCILDESMTLLGIVTDGDVRRVAGTSADVGTLYVADIMTRSPTVVSPTQTLYSALQLMERGERQISVVPVVDARLLCVGVLRVHDIIRAQL